MGSRVSGSDASTLREEKRFVNSIPQFRRHSAASASKCDCLLIQKGNTIEFMLSPYRDRIAAKHFLQLTLRRVGHLRPRVINVDGHPAYPSVIAELKQTGELSKVCRCRPSPYLNNIIEQDHRFVKKRI